jgi:hypothetical protein
MNPMDLIAAATARRTAQGFVANNGIACRSQAEVEYYNYRDTLPREADGRIKITPKLRAMKAATA